MVHNTNIMFVDIIHSPAFYLTHNVSEAGGCFHAQVKPTQLGPIDREREIGTSSTGWAQLKTETEYKMYKI
jgi:hypothetical protein